MLLDRGLLEPGEAGYRVTGDLSALQVPRRSRRSSRRDSTPSKRTSARSSRTRASSGGRSTLAASQRSQEATEESLRPLLDDLVRKELLYLDNDPFSPERGQYGFLQALVQRVAYETLSRRDRKGKHLAAAAYLAEKAGIDPDEIAEVVAAHYLDAFARGRRRRRCGRDPGERPRLARAGGRTSDVTRRSRGGAARIRGRSRARRPT